MIIVSTYTFAVGKSQMIILAEGCIDCGVMEATWAEDAAKHMVKMGDKKYGVMLRRCAGCAEQRGAQPASALR